MPTVLDTGKFVQLIAARYGSQAAFARACEVSPQYISQIVSGVFSPTLERAVQFAALLDCTVDDLIMRPDRPDPEK
jgi:transcriptional regulator with XRE-family HTH domain